MKNDRLTENANRDSVHPEDQTGVLEGLEILPPEALSRRSFLETAGFTLSVAAIGGCDRAPQHTAHPLPEQPAGVIPGRTRIYASTCGGCPSGCGLLVSVRDGRPLKMEGMPEHGLSKGGLCAVGQASPLGLYDSRRLTQPMFHETESSWEEVDRTILGGLEAVSKSKGAVRFVTPTISSPTLKAEIDRFLTRFSDARHIVFDAVSSSAILDAHETTHGKRVLPHYNLSAAKVIVSLGADFLGTWISPVEFTAAWRTRRSPSPSTPEMSFHAQIEGRLSLTGSKADRRYRASPLDFGLILAFLAEALAAHAGRSPIAGSPKEESPLPKEVLLDLAERLWHARGESLVISDSQDVETQILVNSINFMLGNYGNTIDTTYPSQQRQGNDGDVIQLIEELRSEKVQALFVAGTDLTHNLPKREVISEAIRKIPLIVSLGDRMDDLSSFAHCICPDHHWLESWGDYEPVVGLLSLSQPTIAPLRNTRSILESLASWSGRNESAYEILRNHWKSVVFPQTGEELFDSFWDKAVHDGRVDLRPKSIGTPNHSSDSFETSVVRFPKVALRPDQFVLDLYPRVGLTDSRHAHNPWLQELPDPISKVTWDNYAAISSATAARLGIADGDVLEIANEAGDFLVQIPALIQPGHADQVVSLALGYGVKGTDRFARIGPKWIEAKHTVGPGQLVGKNGAGFIKLREKSLSYCPAGITLKKTGRKYSLATTQRQHSLEIPRNVAPHGAEVRDVVQSTTLEAFRRNSTSGAPERHHVSAGDLWPADHPKTGHHWGMVIDQNACTGCSACLIACQSENNVPVVGKDEVHRQREMHWIRIDRYYSGADDDLQVAYQPMMCQHCENAPCETVCPVLATTHSDEGLNEQVYNRCVGTRYCANNCPYKVRRFNWFAYEHKDPLQNLSLNPDVTVRTRGVMEKCSLCVQRIEEGKIAARQRGERIADGEVQTACQQSCPAQAITFGDINDPQSRVRGSLSDPRQYRVLEEFNFKTSVAYLRLVSNRPDVEQVRNAHD